MKPYLYLDIRLPFIRIYTNIMSKSIDCYTYEYISLSVEIFKYNFSFMLYEPGNRRKKRLTLNQIQKDIIKKINRLKNGNKVFWKRFEK